MDRLDEALNIARLMFAEERPSFTGRYYRIERALNSPRPLQSGGPKILVGGGGEKRTLRLAAQYADMTHWFVGSLDEFKHKCEVLDHHCEMVGRDPSSITRTIGVPVDLTLDATAAGVADGPRGRTEVALPERAAEVMSDYVQAGAQGFVFRNANLSTPELLAAAGQVKAMLR
jgi:alkanesulfonate monooxygenase SsuD/methylene tetrahydromethanopterin reductase-like flavin-dependent oxidoreductase (luciferase family)